MNRSPPKATSPQVKTRPSLRSAAKARWELSSARTSQGALQSVKTNTVECKWYMICLKNEKKKLTVLLYINIFVPKVKSICWFSLGDWFLNWNWNKDESDESNNYKVGECRCFFDWWDRPATTPAARSQGVLRRKSCPRRRRIHPLRGPQRHLVQVVHMMGRWSQKSWIVQNQFAN